jgi:hypothetical protein
MEPSLMEDLQALCPTIRAHYTCVGWRILCRFIVTGWAFHICGHTQCLMPSSLKASCTPRTASGRWISTVTALMAELLNTSAPGPFHKMCCCRLRLESSARADYDAVNVETRTMLEAYAAGVNAFVQATDRLPIEYQLLAMTPEPWQPWDACAVFKVRHVFTGGVWQGKLWRARLLRQIGPELTAKLYAEEPSGQPLIIPPGLDYRGPALNGPEALRAGEAVLSVLQELESGSNSWVLSGQRTASGAPLLAGDPIGRSMPPTCSIKIIWLVLRSMPWGCRSQRSGVAPLRP